MRLVCFYFSVVLVLLACSPSAEKEKKALSRQGADNSSGYRFNTPDQVFQLPGELEEISGLATVSSIRLLMTEDETGTLYLYNLEKEAVEKEIVWEEGGDYEGIAQAGETAYVVDSEGTIYRIRDFMSEKPEVEEFKNEALEDCNVEGLFYLQENNELLIACKEGLAQGSREVFSFSLNTNTLQERPYRRFELQEIEEALLSTDLDKFSADVQKLLDPDGESGILFPSGISVHPLTNDLYILSSESKLLVVYDSDGKLKEVVELKNKLYRQPESITFSPNGDLFIGNEGKGGKPNVLKFTYAQE